ncbi:MAG: proteasome-activating nucleotidase [Methanocellales archaeon]|nr:proteasome-activating nucleotidase [Methanocellales archaeon]MDD4898820.1 proteasome-activating nucleotidase [Methanocellales archaeon]MDD5447532.1 proteasome-activating nucleotidase [Methanocellales archaeon]
MSLINITGLQMNDASTDPELDDFSKYLLDRVRQLEEKNLRLWEDYRRIESERRFAENQKIQYEREIRKLKSELERLKGPPLVVGTILDVLENEKVVIKSSTGPKFVVNASQFIEGSSLLPGTRVALNQQTLAVVGVLSPPKDPTVYGMEIIESPSVDYDQIGGLEAQIQELKEIVELPLINPDIFVKVGIKPPKGVLLYGPPGSGKTLMAKAVAKRTEATFIRIVGSELIQKYIGEGARLVRELFEMAREKSPSIIFIDELDAIGAKRLESATSGDREVQRTLMQLLAEMDGFDPRGDVKIIAATNRPDILDLALLRPGRFDRMIEVPLPNLEARTEILKIHTKDMNIADEIDFRQTASVTDGLSGADLSAIAMEAGMFAIRENREAVTMSDFDRAVKKVLANSPKMEPPSEPGEMFA